MSVAQRATEALLERVSDLAEDVSGIGETVRKFNMGAQSQTDALGQIQSDCNRSRYCVQGFRAVDVHLYQLAGPHCVAVAFVVVLPCA